MPKKVKPMERKRQKSINFCERQWMFFDKYPDFNPHTYCRLAIDEQIKLMDAEFLEEKDE